MKGCFLGRIAGFDCGQKKSSARTVSPPSLGVILLIKQAGQGRLAAARR